MPKHPKAIVKTTRAPMIQERQGQIAELVRQNGAMRVDELAEIFQTSEVTIRSDLGKLEREGRLIRDHGGAIPAAGGLLTELLEVSKRAVLHVEEKRRIGKAAAKLVGAGDVFIMDAGTTVVEMARHWAQSASLTVVTNALNVALEVGAMTEARVILLGGNLNRTASSTLGPLVEQSLGDLVVQKVFLGTQAFDVEHGLTDTTMEIAQVKRAMIRAAREVVLLTDSSKWGCAGFVKVAPLTAVHTLVTDTGFSAAGRHTLERAGLKVLLA